jgi:formiminotetrahydrofolate cyclodeaminase
MMLDESLREFARKLAAREPTPGGGAAAGYMGAMGAALAGMAIAYSVKKDENDRARIAELGEGLDYMERLREELLELTEKDSEAYGAYRQARSLPRDTAEEKAERKKQVRRALEEALDIPLRAAHRCQEGMERLEGLIGMISHHLITDAGVSARCFGAACRSLWYNVHINARSLKDAGRRLRLEKEEETMEEALAELESSVLKQVDKIRDR